jgi:hypothetical protein
VALGFRVGVHAGEVEREEGGLGVGGLPTAGKGLRRGATSVLEKWSPTVASSINTYLLGAYMKINKRHHMFP